MGEESPEAYNERVEQALEVLNRRLSGNFFILDSGRTEGEQAVIAVVDGRFAGYGFFDGTQDAWGAEDLLETVFIPYDDPDAAKIIRGYLDAKKGKVINRKSVV